MTEYVMPTVITVFDEENKEPIGSIQLSEIIFNDNGEEVYVASLEAAEKYVLSGKDYKYVYFEFENRDNVHESNAHELKFVEDGGRMLFYHL